MSTVGASVVLYSVSLQFCDKSSAVCFPHGQGQPIARDRLIAEGRLIVPLGLNLGFRCSSRRSHRLLNRIGIPSLLVYLFDIPSWR